jgi:hypothetical protein
MHGFYSWVTSLSKFGSHPTYEYLSYSYLSNTSCDFLYSSSLKKFVWQLSVMPMFTNPCVAEPQIGTIPSSAPQKRKIFAHLWRGNHSNLLQSVSKGG